MRIDLPTCSFKYCRYEADGNCTAKGGKREGCEYERKNSDVEDLCIKINTLEQGIEELQAELEQYKELGTVDEVEQLLYLRERYENEEYDFCGEYGTDDCQFKDVIERYQKAKNEGRLIIVPSDSDCENCLLLCGNCGSCMHYGYGKHTKQECQETILAYKEAALAKEGVEE